MKAFLFISICLMTSFHQPKKTWDNGKCKLDQILGDKVIDAGKNQYRSNNFTDFLKLTKNDLEQESELYSVKVIDANYYLVEQKKGYETARCFTVLLKLKNQQVKKYYILNDFKIVDYVKKNDQLLLLCSDWGNQNIYWKKKYQALILLLDADFNEKWKYEAYNKSIPIDANKIVSKKQTSKVLVNAISGCHICYNTVELEIDQQGKCLSSRKVSEQHPDKIFSQGFLDSVFVKK